MTAVVWIVAFLSFGWGASAWGQPGLLANPSFERGDKEPLGWSLSAGQGEWLKTGGVDNAACVMIEGNGTDSGAWQSAPVSFLPGRVYRLSFDARTETANGGTAVSGPAFANVDVGVPGKTWSHYEQVFATPFKKDSLTSSIHLGQWQMKGQLFFDTVRLFPVEPVYASAGNVTLGAGEKLVGNAYSFDAPLGGEGRNHSRPLLFFSAHFNSDRWCFSEGTVVTYRHAVTDRHFVSGCVDVGCNYYVSGKLLVDVSNNGKDWQPAGTLTHTGRLTVDLPTSLFPAEAVYVRLRGAKPPCNLQVNSFAYRGQTDGEPVSLEGDTRYIQSVVKNPKISVLVQGLGAAVPGGQNTVDLKIQNMTRAALPTVARVIFSRPDSPAHTNLLAVTLPLGGPYNLCVPYEVPGTGLWQMSVELGAAYTAQSSVYVSDYYDDSYGELIPVNNPKLNLWRASSGWKIPQNRGLPRQIAKSLVLRMAQNEWEALQLVVTPNVELSNVTVRAGALVLGKNTIPAENIDVLRVGYVPVTKKTDPTGTLSDWPDPLPPQKAPIHLAAGRNQPYWIRVKAPKDVPAGIYRGTVTVEADGVNVSTVLNVEVYGFALPDTLTCETSFGFSPSTVWRYQKVTDPAQRREVLDKYLASLSAHHISPYNPAPMDGWSVTWPGLNAWTGGMIVTNEKFEGQGSLFVKDVCTNDNRCAAYPQALPLPAQGFKVAFKHKTDRPHRFLFSLSYQKAGGEWMSGHNTDIAIDGKPEWQSYEKLCTTFPKEAVTCRLSLWAAGYQETGAATGSLWVDDLSITDVATGKSLVEGGALEPLDVSNVVPVFDWSKWDAAMDRALNTYHFNSFVMHIDGLGGGTFQGRTEPVFLGYAENQPEYGLLFGKYLKGIENHLREKGWLDKAYVYWFDEPDRKDYAFVMNGFAKLKKYAPGLRRMLTEQVEKELVGGPNLWVPLTPSLNVERTEAQRKDGDQFWWYVCCGPKAPYATEFIDHPGTEMRVWLWQTWAERVTGVLIWETVYWTSPVAYPDHANPQNPYRDAMSWVSDGDLAPGTKNAWGNGDGRFMYPPEAAANGKPDAPVLDGPVDSIRLELLRDGLEDYEYFVMLKRLLTEKASKLDTRTRANLEALLVVPKEVSSSLTSFTRDPTAIETHRDRLARAIVELLK